MSVHIQLAPLEIPKETNGVFPKHGTPDVAAASQGWGTIPYKSTAEVLRDVRRVWDSYRSSYDPTDPVV